MSVNPSFTEKAEIITLILKYFNFEQLCIAERINCTLQYFVRSELRRLKIVNLCRILSREFVHHHLIVQKVSLYAPNIQQLISYRNLTEHISWLAFSEHPPLLKLTKLHISYSMNFFNFKNICDYLRHLPNLTDLKLSVDCRQNARRKNLDANLLDKMNDSVNLSNLISFELNCMDCLWHYLPKCRNLTKLCIINNKLLDREQHKVLYTLIYSNPNLEILALCGVKINAKFLDSLKFLTKLKSLSYFALSCFRSEQTLCHPLQIQHWLNKNIGFEFPNLDELNISVHTENQVDFSPFFRVLLKTCLRLKHLELLSDDQYLNSTILRTNPTLPYVECIHINTRDDIFLESMTVDKLADMTRLKHLHTSGFFSFNDATKIARLKNLQLLHLYENCKSYSEFDENYLSTMKDLLSGLPKLKGLRIQLKSNRIQLVTLMDFILNYCSDLEYLSLKNVIITKDQAKDLPNRLPLLKFLSINYSKCYSNKIEKLVPEVLKVEDMTTILGNLRFLLVFTSHHFYYPLMELGIIKKRCRRGDLVVSSSKAQDLEQKWMEHCCGPCCSYSRILKREILHH